MQAIFMVGEQRSGSNLLRLILNESGIVAGPHPPHVLQRMMPLLHLYGNLNNEQNFSRLIEDVCRLVELNPVPWEGIVFDRRDVRRRCRTNSLVAVYGAVMEIYADTHHAGAWMCKSMQNIRWADELNAYFDKPKYIYLYRDPRDVVLSFSKAVIGDKHPYAISQQWTELQNLCLAQRDILSPESFFSLCYEELTSRPEEVVNDLCAFLGIEFTAGMLSFYNSGEAERSAKSSQLWENLTKPIDSSNSRKFLKELSEEDIRIVESVAGNVMDELGYERVHIQAGAELYFSDRKLDEFMRENKRRMQAMSRMADPGDLKRRQQQSSFLADIIAMGRMVQKQNPRFQAAS